MTEKQERILSEGVEIRLVSEEKDQIEQIGDAFSRWARENLPIAEFFDGGTCLSTHPRYKGTYIRRIYLKIKTGKERAIVETGLKEPITAPQPKPEEAYEELDRILKEEGATVEPDPIHGRRRPTFRKVNGISVVYRFSRLHKRGSWSNFFFGLSPEYLYHAEWVLFICGRGNRTFVIPRDWLEQRLKNAPLAQDGNWRINIYKRGTEWVMGFGVGRTENITSFLNYFGPLTRR